jgi:GNAT superfamily N-acetyltransferase
MSQDLEIKTIDASNLDRLGFFCYKSKRKSAGYAAKLAWVRARLAEGMRLHILYEDGVSKGFIEYIPGEFAWRAVHAEGYLFIHCMWVVGEAKGMGYGTRLLRRCIQDAREGGYIGVAMLASEQTWLADRRFFEGSGFEVIDSAAPAFSLMALQISEGQAPSLPSNWESRIANFGEELTVIFSDQCPYLARMKHAVHRAAAALGIPSHEVKHSSARDVQNFSPSPYGVYNITYKGELIASHPVGTDALLELMRSRV